MAAEATADEVDYGALVAQHYIDAWAKQFELMSAADRLKADILAANLAIAVPLWIDRYREMCWEEGHRRAQICMGVVAERGDQILYRSPKKGETAHAFNRLAEGLAILSTSPGGVTFAGQHWESPPLRTLAEIVADLDARAAEDEGTDG
jgi:hypothetical protein